jgi:hypothetical protein
MLILKKEILMKRNITKFFAGIAVICLLVTATLMIEAGAVSASTISASSETAQRGSSVDVVISLDRNPGIWSMGLEVSYDHSALTLTGFTAGGIFASDEITPPPSLHEETYLFIASRDSLTDTQATGTLVTLTFTVAADAVYKDYPIILTLSGNNTINVNDEAVGFNTVNGSVSVPHPKVAVTFDANGGTGGTRGSMSVGSPLTPPAVSKAGYVFTGWSPSVPSSVPAENTTYTAQYIKTAVSLTKLAEGFKVNIKGWAANYKYQIWSYQKITSDMFSSETVSQWILSKPYTVGSSGAAESDGSISFNIADFVSPDSNYTIAVRITDADGKYLGEIRDSYTPAEVSEVKISKVLVDGKYSTGIEIREITTGAAMNFTVIGNNVAGTVYSAKVLESGTSLTAISANEFNWDISSLTAGTYTLQFTASNGMTSDTKNITVHLYSLDTGIHYGNISDLAFSATDDTILPKTMAVNPVFTNGSFYYSVCEPGRKPIFTSGLFAPADSIHYTFTKYGIYQVSGFVNREYEVRIGDYYDDGFIKNFIVSRSQTGTSSATLNSNVDIGNPVDKGTQIIFTANASIAGIGQTPVQYSFWRYDAKGYALVKDWSSDNTLNWTPARVGTYTIEIRAKGADAGSYEVAKSVKVTVTDTIDQTAQGVVISINESELNANAQARVPITIKAEATSENMEGLLYKFNIADSAMGVKTVQNYSANQECIWTPRKAGTYTISVLVKSDASFGAYDAVKTFTVTVD